MNNHNHWGSQPPRQPYNGLPQMHMTPQQQQHQQQQQQQHHQQQFGHGYQQQPYGGGSAGGNAMAYIGNQQYQTSPQYIPQASNQHQMQQMHHYTQSQPQHQPHNQHQHFAQTHSQPQPLGQPHPMSNYHAQHYQAQQPQMQQQPRQQHYSNGTYNHHSQMPQPQFVPQQQSYPQVHAHAYPSQQQHPVQRQAQHVATPSPRQIQQALPPQAQPQQIATPSPRQVQRPLPPPRPQPTTHSQGQLQSPQPISRPTPAARPTHAQTQSQVQGRHQVPSPRFQQQVPPSANPAQLRQVQAQPHVPSPQPQHRAPPLSIDPSQLQQNNSFTPSPQPQHPTPTSIEPTTRLQQSHHHAPSPKPLQQTPVSIEPTRLQQTQQHAPSPRLQQHTPTSLDPNKLQQNQYQLPPPKPQYNQHDSIDPSQLFQSVPHAAPVQQQQTISNAIDPSQLSQGPLPTAPDPAPRPIPDAVDPSKLQSPQPAPAQIQRPQSEAIDPSQLFMKTDAPAKKPMAPASNSSAKSPSLSTTHSPSQHFDTPAVLTCVASDCFKAAHSAVQHVASSLSQPNMDEYYKLIATGLGCLEAALSLNKLPPRTEANIRLRYATILSEETDNLTEAEVALTKGIAVCEKHRLTDLKYCMQFQLLKVLFRRNRKAALVALDKNISEASTYKAVDWVYAFRFLKASFHLQSANPADNHAMDNLRSIASMATHRGDSAIVVLTALLEGMIHLRSRREDSITRVQTCIAQASRYQLDPQAHIPQIEVLALLMDLACSLQQKTHQVVSQKLRALQYRMDELVQTSDWDHHRDELLLPLKKQPNSSTSVTGDTSTIIRSGNDGQNYIVMSFVTKVHMFVLAYVVTGLGLLYQGSRNEKVMEYWAEALAMLANSHEDLRPHAYSLPMAMEQAKWRAEVGCYIHTLIALMWATRTQWTKVRDCLKKIDALRPKPTEGRLGLLALYVQGMYYQGTADLEKAYQIFSDERFAIADQNSSETGSPGTHPAEVAILATLNRIWILQEPSRRDDEQTMELLEKVRPYCTDHPDIDVRTAFNVVAAGIVTDPPQSIQTVKRHISSSVKSAQAANNTQLLAIALNLMRSCLFESVVGDQAVKSAKAGRTQAQKAGNLLWMSVGEGMLAQTEEMQGQVEEAELLRRSGTAHANEAFLKPEGA